MYSSELIIQGDVCVHADFMCLLIFNADFCRGICQDTHLSCTVLIFIMASPFPTVKTKQYLLYCLTYPGRLFKVFKVVCWQRGGQMLGTKLSM